MTGRKARQAVERRAGVASRALGQENVGRPVQQHDHRDVGQAAAGLFEAQIERGELRLSAMIDALPSRVIVPRDEVARFGTPARLFANINSATDLADALLLANTAATTLTEYR